MILLIDNYDSFSYNLYQQAAAINPDIKIIRNDAMTASAIEDLKPSHILLSPGPGYPKDAGVCEEVIKRLGSMIPILGVCLGHQAICEVYGAQITHAKQLMHGKTSTISVNNADLLFAGLPKDIEAARYHSLIASPETLPDCLMVLAEDNNGEIMAVRHIQHAIFGVQFHPESILTPLGDTILQNFLSIGG